MKPSLLIFVFASLLAIGCATTVAEVEDPTLENALARFTDEDIETLAADDRAFEEAFNNGDMAKVASFYKEDAVVIAFGGAPIHGKGNIQAFFETLPPVKDLVLSDDYVNGFGNNVIQRGTITMTILMEDGTEVPFKGNFLVTRERQADGNWLYVNDMFDEEAAPAAE